MIGIMPRITPALTEPSIGEPIGELPVGNTVRIPVNGTLRDFIIVHQGVPSKLYDHSCDGAWLLMKDIYVLDYWENNNGNRNDFEKSSVKMYLNNIWMGLLDSAVQKFVKTVKIPYRPGAGSETNVNANAKGLQLRAFLLSGYEMGYTVANAGSYVPKDGSKLSYFNAGSGLDAKEVAKFNGTATEWWLRSPYCWKASGAQEVITVGPGGRANKKRLFLPQ